MTTLLRARSIVDQDMKLIVEETPGGNVEVYVTSGSISEVAVLDYAQAVKMAERIIGAFKHKVYGPEEI